MVKNYSGGNKSKGMARKNLSNNDSKSLRVSQDINEMYGIVEKYHGNKMCDVLCYDGEQRLCHIRGKFTGRGKRDNNVEKNKWVLVGIRDYETISKNKKANCDLLEVYNDKDKETLKTTIKLNWGIFTKLEMNADFIDTNEEDANNIIQFMDKTTEDHLNLMSACLEVNKDSNSIASEQDWIDVNEL
jgi:initiation factor 1A